MKKLNKDKVIKKESIRRADNDHFARTLLTAIGVGEENKLSSVELTDLMQQHKKGTQKKGGSFKKEVQRVLKKYTSDTPEEGLILTVVGRANYYCWSSDEDKAHELVKFEMSPERAFGLSFIETYLENILPPNIYNSLKADFHVADNVLKKTESNRKWLEKLDFNSSGLATFSSIEKASMPQDDVDKWQDIFEYTFKEHCFSANYPSIHDEYNRKLILSPQRITLFNNQLMLLAYEHGNETHDASIKFFEIKRLTNVEKSTENHHSLTEDEYTHRHKVKAICHTWVKQYFESVDFGSPIKFSTTKSDDCWLMEVTTQFPLHFDKSGRDDPFFFANYIGMFADSIKIIEPKFLFDEMQRRSKAIADLYDRNEEEKEFNIISSSPDNMAKRREA